MSTKVVKWLATLGQLILWIFQFLFLPHFRPQGTTGGQLDFVKDLLYFLKWLLIKQGGGVNESNSL
jgi:hypothetical protein